MTIISNYLLFNHTYLRKLQADGSVDERASFVAQGVRDWYGFRDGASIESLVSSWVQPVLNSLELDLQSSGQGNGHVHLLYRVSDWSRPVGLCYVVPPGADLDTTTKGRHWMVQAVLAARGWKPAESDKEDEVEDHEKQALRWVILTNGHQWRLLDAQALRRYEAYLQVDLEELVRDPGDLSALRVFYHCFHRSAFEGNAGGRSGLDRLLDESNHATKKAEDHLKACVSATEGVMAHLCLGLVEATGRDHFTEEERDAIYQDATYLLYRLLFIMYAEARNLLPMDNPSYQQASLATLVETAHIFRLQGIPDPQARTLWLRLKRLCNAIYESDPELGIPAYNGGLFDDGDKPHLRVGTIADGHLTQALFDLAYQPDGDVEEGQRQIDYRDLSVRHLGSIYEGMIEYKLQIAEETLWARRDAKGNVRFLKTSQDGAPRRNDVEITRGDVYFSQSPGERRATGTYYTPEFVVDYIVEQTVWRELEARRAPLEKKVEEWCEEIAAAFAANEQARMQHTADEGLAEFIEQQVLTFRVCDPAMGSGHFLVNASHQVTNLIVETLHLTPWTNEAIDADPVAWRRQVVEHCLYGVDLSLMAVELAKLSLWLASVAEGNPLSFLNHHLQHGNSLIGLRLDNLLKILGRIDQIRPSRKEREARQAGQLTMLDHPAFQQHLDVASRLLAQISARVTETVDDIKSQEADYDKVKAELTPYQMLASVVVASDFGVVVKEQDLEAVSKQLNTGVEGPKSEHSQVTLEIRELVDRLHFLHWELAFPRVLLGDQDGTPPDARGFDALVGNPPYVSIERIPQSERTFLYSNFSSLGKRFDLYQCFVEIGLRLLKTTGYFGMILPNTFLMNASFVALRRQLLERSQLVEIVDLPQGIFPDVTVDNVLLFYQAERPSTNHEVTVKRLVPNAPRRDFINRRWSVAFSARQHAYASSPSASFNIYLDPRQQSVFRRLESCSVSLGKITDSSQGIILYKTKEDAAAGLFTSFTQEDESWSRLLRGTDIGRYTLSWSGEYVKYGDWLWCARDPRYFEQPKILLQALRNKSLDRRLIGVIDEEGYYNAHNLANIIALPASNYDLYYILAVFNSTAINFWYKNHFPNVNINPSDFRKVPVRLIRFTTPDETRANFAEQGFRLYKSCSTGGKQGDFIRFIENELSQQPERTDVVHDLLAHLAAQMIYLNKHRQRLEGDADLFRFLDRGIPCLRLDKALGGTLGLGEIATDLSAVRHDIEALHLTQEDDNRWLLSVQAKLRDPGSDWREHQRNQDGSFVREWIPAYRLALNEATGRFYHYALANLGGFDGAGKFPGGYTRTTLEKLKATKVPKFVPVDLAPLAALETELAEVRRKIQLTDDLIDQIVYRLYGLTEEEIAIVEGKA